MTTYSSDSHCLTLRLEAYEVILRVEPRIRQLTVPSLRIAAERMKKDYFGPVGVEFDDFLSPSADNIAELHTIWQRKNGHGCANDVI